MRCLRKGYNRGANNPMFGKHPSEETKAKIRATKIANKNPNWKGDNASKQAGGARARAIFECPEGLERHHKDGNPLNNAPENISFVTRKQHMELDGRIKNLYHGYNKKLRKRIN